MSYDFNNKDYGEYFSAVEKRLNNQNSAEKPQAPKPKTDAGSKNAAKRVYGGVFKLRPWVYVATIVLIAVLLLIIFLPKKAKADGGNTALQTLPAENVEKTEEQAEPVNRYAKTNSNTAAIDGDIKSESVIVINCNTDTVVAERNSSQKCYPASTTKIMTVLTAVDCITDYEDTFTFSYAVTDPFYRQEATMAGFSNEESVNMTDMLYGAILPSGADACVGLAVKIAGSEAAFVELMNKKAEDLGLKNTHFTNTTGLFDQEHYTTAEDMAVIIREAAQNEICRKVLSTYQYTTAATPQHPSGILLTSTLFSYMYGTEPEGADISGGKTGFVNESGYCIATFGKSEAEGGDEYVCVTLKGAGLWPTVYDQINLYTRYAK